MTGAHLRRAEVAGLEIADLGGHWRRLGTELWVYSVSQDRRAIHLTELQTTCIQHGMSANQQLHLSMSCMPLIKDCSQSCICH